MASGRKSKSSQKPAAPTGGSGFDPSVPLMDLGDAPTVLKGNPRDIASFEIPTQAKARPPKQAPVDLGAVEMSEPLLDVDTLVADKRSLSKTPAPGGTVVTAPPMPKAVVPRAKARNPLIHYVIAGGLMAATWGAAGAAAVSRKAPELPELETIGKSDPTSETKAPSAAPAADPEPEPEQVAEASEPTAEDAARVWSMTLDSTPRAIRAVPGAIVAQLDEGLVGIVEGEQAWSKEGAFVGLVSVGDMVVTTQGGEVLGFGAGEAPDLTAEIPLPTRGKKKQSEVVAVAGGDEFAVLALSDARFIAVTPTACSEGSEDCTREVGSLRGEYLEQPAGVAIGEEGMRYLSEEDTMRAFDIGFATAFSLAAASEITAMTSVPGNRLAVRFGPEVALLDVARCRGRAEVRLLEGGASTGPRGCVLWRYGKRLDVGAPAAVDTSRVAINEDGKLQVIEAGDDAWKSPLGSVGPVVSGQGQLFTLVRTKAGYALASVDSRMGTVTWSLPLPLTVDEDGTAPIALDWRLGEIAVAVGPQVALVQQPS